MMPSFPDYVFINDQSLQRMDVPNILRSQMETGAEKTRPIQNIPMFRIQAEITICEDKITDFRTWYKNSLGHGAYWFLMNDPFDGTRRRFRFVEYNNNWQKRGTILTQTIILEAYDEL